MSEPTWDDERLAAAFHARFDRSAPPTLLGSIHAAIAGSAPVRPGLAGRLPRLAGVAAAVVLLVGAAAIGIGTFSSSGGGPPATASTGPSGADTATATNGIDASPGVGPTAPNPPTSVLGLAVVPVSQALTVRDAGVDDHELAVGGWFTPGPVISCPAPTQPVVSPIQIRCPDELTWLTENADSLVHVTGNEQITDAPHGPALNPDLDGLDLSWAPPLPMVGVDGGSTPAHVVMLGHFDDRRAAACPRAEQTKCRDRFVVDQVAWVNGAAPAPSQMNLLGANVQPRSSIADVQAILAVEAPHSPELSMTIVDGPGLKSIEPSVGTSATVLTAQPILWIARLLESERLSTYLVVDGTDAIFEMRPDGGVLGVGGSLGSPPPAAQWPPTGSVVVVQLTSPVGAGQPPAQVAVIDRSGRLTRAFEKGSRAPLSDPGAAGFAAYPEPGLPGGVHLAWIGTICDVRITVTVGADLRSITLDPGPRPPCDAMAIGREVVLDFSGSVDVPAIKLNFSTTVY